MTKVRTSKTDPLMIDLVSVPGDRGIIGMTFCPGKKDNGLFYGLWDRDLEIDLDAIKAWGASALVSLVEEHELHLLGVSELPARAVSMGLHWIHLPIKDGDVPDETFLELWMEAAPMLHQLLDQGAKILLHCKGGLGRTGTVAALLLVERGMEPEYAVRLVRAARPGTVETFSQERYILSLRKRGVIEDDKNIRK